MKVFTKFTQGFVKVFFVLIFIIAFLFISISLDIEDESFKKVDTNKSLLIGSFNIQIFGESKMSKPNVVASLVEILSRYDIVLIQEIRDKKGEAIIKLLHRLNIATGNKYDLVLSDRLGNSNSKEQYAFIYNKYKLEVLKVYNYLDKGNKFEREPFSVKFKYLDKDFILSGIHVDPDLVFEELNELDEAIENINTILSDFDLVLMGDFNADCNYISEKDLKKLDIFIKYSWLIDSKTDTTTSKTDCAYDRIIVTDSLILNVKSSRVYHFDKEQGLNKKETKRVSDHYPVEFLLDFNWKVQLFSWTFLYYWLLLI